MSLIYLFLSIGIPLEPMMSLDVTLTNTWKNRLTITDNQGQNKQSLESYKSHFYSKINSYGYTRRLP